MQSENQVILPQIVEGFFQNQFLEMSQEEYHLTRDAVHYSTLKEMIKSPHAYYHALKYPRKQTKIMKFGTLAHLAILEGSKFLSNYVVEPEFQGLTKEGIMSTRSKAAMEAKKEWHDNLKPGTEIVTQKEFDDLRFMMDSMLSHKFVQEILKDGIPEAKGIWIDPATKLKNVFSADFLSNDCNLLVDVKTTQDCDWYAFRRSVESLHYYLQVAKYSRGIEAITGKEPQEKVWLTIESVAPYEVRVHFVDPFYQDAGAKELRRCLSQVKTCIQTGLWPQGQTIIESGEPTMSFRQHHELRGVE